MAHWRHKWEPRWVRRATGYLGITWLKVQAERNALDALLALVVSKGHALVDSEDPQHPEVTAEMRELWKRYQGARASYFRIRQPRESWKIGNFTYLSQEEYRDLRDGAMELLRRFPPEKYYFVGLGRDPAPVIAFLQNLGGKRLAVNLPGLSNIGDFHRLSQQSSPEKRVARYIEAAIAPEIFASGRGFVLLDVSNSGMTPAIFGPFFDRYLATKGIQETSEKVAFTWEVKIYSDEFSWDETDDRYRALTTSYHALLTTRVRISSAKCA